MVKAVTMDKSQLKSMFLSVGSYAPKKILTNFDLEKSIDTNNEWIVTRTGIEQRYVTDDTQNTADLATEAGKIALEKAEIPLDEIDLLICATSTPDRFTPATAAYVQKNLNIPANAMTFDLSAGCSGWLYAVELADAMIRKGAARYALVVGAETLSKHLNWEDRSSCVLFGDGAGAAVMSAENANENRHYVMQLGNTTIDQDKLVMGNIHGSGEKFNHVIMNGKIVFKSAVERITNSSKEVLAQAGLQVSDIKYFICHQANARIVDAVTSRLGLSQDQVPVNVQKFGNTGAASIPILLDELYRADKLQRGDHLIMAAFGAGFSWGSSVITW